MLLEKAFLRGTGILHYSCHPHPVLFGSAEHPSFSVAVRWHTRHLVISKSIIPFSECLVKGLENNLHLRETISSCTLLSNMFCWKSAKVFCDLLHMLTYRLQNAEYVEYV